MRSVKEKGITCIVIAFFAVIALLAGAYAPRVKADAADDFRLWRQNDIRWGNEPIGGSTVRQSGCYMTSIAMAAVASGARDTEDFDPGVFARELNKINAFNQWGGLASWGSVNKVIAEVSITSKNLNFTSADQSGKAAEIKKCLDEGNYVICNVGGHWVYIDGVIGDDVYMADPAKDEILMFEAYNNESIAFYQTLKGKEPYNGFTPLYDSAEDETAEETTAEVAAAVTTTTASALASVKVSASKTGEAVFSTGEYCCTESRVLVFDEPDPKSTAGIVLVKGNVVNVVKVSGDFGEVRIDGKNGWVDFNSFCAASTKKLEAGDINDDGVSDEYDLAVINEYLSSIGVLPEGVSVLTSSEISAADINGDGVVDNTDVLMFLMLVCN